MSVAGQARVGRGDWRVGEGALLRTSRRIVRRAHQLRFGAHAESVIGPAGGWDPCFAHPTTTLPYDRNAL